MRNSRSISRTILSLLIATTYILASVGSGVHEILRHGQTHTAVTVVTTEAGGHYSSLTLEGGAHSTSVDIAASCIFCASGPIVVLLPSTTLSSIALPHVPPPSSSLISRIFRVGYLTPSLRGPPSLA